MQAARLSAPFQCGVLGSHPDLMKYSKTELRDFVSGVISKGLFSSNLATQLLFLAPFPPDQIKRFVDAYNQTKKECIAVTTMERAQTMSRHMTSDGMTVKYALANTHYYCARILDAFNAWELSGTVSEAFCKGFNSNDEISQYPLTADEIVELAFMRQRGQLCDALQDYSVRFIFRRNHQRRACSLMKKLINTDDREAFKACLVDQQKLLEGKTKGNPLSDEKCEQPVQNKTTVDDFNNIVAAWAKM